MLIGILGEQMINSGLNIGDKLIATLFGFFGGSMAVLFKPWLEKKGIELLHPIRLRHQCWIFLAGYEDMNQTRGIELEAGKWGPRRCSSNFCFSFKNDPDGRNYTCELPDRGEIADLVARGLVEVQNGHVQLTNDGLLKFEGLKDPFFDQQRCPLLPFLKPVT